MTRETGFLMSGTIEVSRVENALISNPSETAQMVGDVGWQCSFDVPGILLDINGEYRVMVSRQTAVTLGHELIAAARDGG